MKRLLYILITFSILGCSKILMNDFDNTEIKYQDFETAWLVVDEVYPFFEFKKLNWDSIHDVYLPKIEAVKGDEYLDVIFDMLCELNDGHVGMELPGGKYIYKKLPRQIKDEDAFDLNVTIDYLDDKYELIGNKHIGHATINKEIGYIHIGTLMDWESHWIYAIDDVIDSMRKTKGLILDVRHNGGGSSNNGDYIISHFLNDELQKPGMYIDNEYIAGSFIQPREPYYNKKVIILTNGVCFSSTEDFLGTIKQLKNVILVGDTTGGGSSAPKYFPLPSGIEIRVSTKFILQYNQTPIEWNGVVPDILIPQTKMDIANKRDKQLKYAINFFEN